MSRILRPVLIALCWCAVPLACKQAEGERCEVDGDCEGGLVCENPSLTGGRCVSRSSGPAATPDAGLDAPAADGAGATVDATVDAAPLPDAAPAPDAPAPDAPASSADADAPALEVAAEAVSASD